MTIGRNSREDGIVFPISDASQRNGSRVPILFADLIQCKTVLHGTWNWLPTLKGDNHGSWNSIVVAWRANPRHHSIGFVRAPLNPI